MAAHEYGFSAWPEDMERDFRYFLEMLEIKGIDPPYNDHDLRAAYLAGYMLAMRDASNIIARRATNENDQHDSTHDKFFEPG